MMEGRWAEYGKDGRIRKPFSSWSIYAIFCMENNSSAFVKIGISSIVYDRVLALQAGMIFPVGVVLHCATGNRIVTQEIETKIHHAFCERKTQGEWFKFDLSNPADKAEFHRVTKMVVERYSPTTLVWKKITPDQIMAYQSLKIGRKAEAKIALAERCKYVA
jgi:hypothetical protein